MSDLPKKEIPTSALVISHDDLLVCVDDTGHELLAPGHSFYGLGGCAVLGNAYHSIINQPWQTIRKAVAGNNNIPLHASEFKRRATLEHFEMVSRFFAEQPFMRFGAAGATTTILPDTMPLMKIVIEGLKRRIVDVARYWPFRSIVVVFEDNPRANPLVERYFGDFHVEENGEQVPVECCFMPKSQPC